MTEKFTRHPAIKVLMISVNKGKYIQEDDKNPNYLLMDGVKTYRLNAIAAVVQKEEVGSITNMLLDDGTGKIVMRSFEESKVVKEIDVGDVVLVVGKVRTYNDEKYISPEIIKKCRPAWLKLRSLELKKPEIEQEMVVEEQREGVSEAVEGKNESYVEENKNIPEETIKDNENIKTVDESDVVIDDLLPNQLISKIIKDLDEGEGVLIENIIDKSTLEDAEEIIDKMLEAGEIFQIQPGKVKVL
jgi:RPA family protein